jgi:large subunit ribosomal protein L35
LIGGSDARRGARFPGCAGRARAAEGVWGVPKMKTHRGAAKRFARTGGGRFKHKRAYHGHLYTKKSAKTKRPKRRPALVHPADVRRVRRLLPYS